MKIAAWVGFLSLIATGAFASGLDRLVGNWKGSGTVVDGNLTGECSIQLEILSSVDGLTIKEHANCPTVQTGFATGFGGLRFRLDLVGGVLGVNVDMVGTLSENALQLHSKDLKSMHRLSSLPNQNGENTLSYTFSTQHVSGYVNYVGILKRVNP